MRIEKKDPAAIAVMREAGHYLARIVSELTAMLQPGVRTSDLEAYARGRLEELDADAAFLGYTAKGNRVPFPSALCTSINEELIHAPSLPSRTLKDGDIIGLDFGLRYPGVPVASSQLSVVGFSGAGQLRNWPTEKLTTSYYVDMAVTVPVGKINPRTQTLLTVTREALDRAIAAVKPGARLKDIARVVQSHVEANGFSVARDYVGHGIGKQLHEPPEVPNFVSRDFPDVVLEEGMTLAIEPMVLMGNPELIHGSDGWTVKTTDGSLAAHFEHTIAVTATGIEVLTK